MTGMRVPECPMRCPSRRVLTVSPPSTILFGDLRPYYFPLSSDNPFQEDVVKAERLKEIIKALMSSRFYFDLDVRERHRLVAHVMRMMETRKVA